MQTMLDIVEEACQADPMPWPTPSTTTGNAAYEGYWAVSVTWGEVVDDDRINDNPINGSDPTGQTYLEVLGAAAIAGGLTGIMTVAVGVYKKWTWKQIAYTAGTNAALTFAAVAAPAMLFTWGGMTTGPALLATGLILTPTSLGLAIGNFQSAMKYGDTGDQVFATIDLAIAIIGAFLVAKGTTSLPYRVNACANAAEARLVAMRNNYRSGVAATITTAKGDPFTGFSTGAQRSAGLLPEPIDADTASLLDSIEESARSVYHAKCGEPSANTKVNAAGADPAGAWSAALRLADGQWKPACASCRQMLQMLGIRDAVGTVPDNYAPVLWLVKLLFPDNPGSGSVGPATTQPNF
jgi:hypothetical protein